MSDELTEALAEFFSLVIQKARHDKGGPGSGNWAHAGRPGSRGGSASSGGNVSGLKDFESARSFSVANFNAAQKWADDESWNWTNELTPGQKGNLQEYTGDGFGEFNDYLRDHDGYVNEPWYSPSAERVLMGKISSAKGGIKKAELSEDVIIWRGSTLPEGSVRVGKILTDDAFGSHTLIEEVSSAIFGPGTGMKVPKGHEMVILEVLARKGSKVGSLSKISEVPGELEMITSPGSQFEIVETVVQRGTIYAKAIFVGQD